MPHPKQGIVYLVGAGPGDPGLLTVKGKQLLEQADAVVYDALSDPRLLNHCPQAEQIYVGKRASQHTLTQDQINELLIKLAQQNKRVVRLKGGDPFVFGRGGEECEALKSASIPFEIVPGITAAIAAPAYAGIPVTHRDFNSTFTLVTGHEKEGDASTLDWSTLAKLPALAFYMGIKSLPSICTKLVQNGMNPEMPAATIQWGTTPRQRTVVATVESLVKKIEEAGITAPAMTIIGQVVTLRDTIKWFETKPLFGQTILVTRTRQQASELSQKLEGLGAAVLEAPTIEIHPAADSSHFDQALARLHEYDWIVFTSPNGVAQTKIKLNHFNLDARSFGKVKIATIGDATAQAVRDQLCLNVDLTPKSFVAEALADELDRRGEITGRKFLLLRADIARPVLRQRLDLANAAQVHDVAIYDTRLPKALPQHVLDALEEGRITWITFTSSSTAKNFVELLGSDYKEQLSSIKRASIGPITSQTLNELGIPPTIEATTFDIEGLVEAIKSHRG